jgi:DNA-binding LacI/PurR family transcriptional regulator
MGDDRSEKRPKRAGLVAVARAVGVSPSTVSNAYNRPDQLSPALRERVLRTAADLGYAGPDPVARSLRRGRAGAVGVVFHDRLAYAFDDPAAVLFLQGLTEATDETGLAVVLVPGPATKGAAVRNAAVDGLILHGLLDDDPVLTATVERRLPTVVVDAPMIAGLDFVGIDDTAAAATAAGHLLDLGHRRIGLLSFLHGSMRPETIGPPDLATGGDTVARRRLEGCLRALADRGLGWDDAPVAHCLHSNAETGRAAAHALLAHDPSITAVFAFSDPLALGAKAAATERGLAVPGDLSIVGFDDTAPPRELLTTVHQPQRDKGRLAAERLVRALGADAPAPRRELLPTRLVPRGSTSAPRIVPAA